MSLYAPLNVSVATPRVVLRGATDELLEALAPLVAAGEATADPPPWDEAHSEGAVDNVGSNAVSERLGYERNGLAWATHQGQPVLGQRWRLDREMWKARRRQDITMTGVVDCRQALGIAPGAET